MVEDRSSFLDRESIETTLLDNEAREYIAGWEKVLSLFQKSEIVQFWKEKDPNFVKVLQGLEGIVYKIQKSVERFKIYKNHTHVQSLWGLLRALTKFFQIDHIWYECDFAPEVIRLPNSAAIIESFFEGEVDVGGIISRSLSRDQWLRLHQQTKYAEFQKRDSDQEYRTLLRVIADAEQVVKA